MEKFKLIFMIVAAVWLGIGFLNFILIFVLTKKGRQSIVDGALWEGLAALIMCVLSGPMFFIVAALKIFGGE